MVLPRIKVIFATVVFFCATACGVSSTIDRSDWSEDRRQLEASFFRHVDDTQLLELMSGPSEIEAFQHALTTKGSGLQDLDSTFVKFSGDQDGDEEVLAWARFRSAQLFLNLACEIEALPMPSELTEEQGELYRSMLIDTLIPLIAHAENNLQGASDAHQSPWDQWALEILGEIDDFSEEPGRSCENTLRHWHPQSMSR